ncbi:MAG: ABC transporter permease [Coriobacteriia bacterium]|nr:ABC transporter permease [Coriobacteriia bacterium]
MSINVGYFLRESMQNFKRNWVMTLGAVITIYLSLLLVGVFLVTGSIVNSVVKSVEDKVSIQIFLKDGASSDDVSALQKALLADSMVQGVDYTSKTAALAKLKEEMGSEITDQLDGNPLPASLDVTLKDTRNVETVVASIKGNALFTKVADHPDDPEQSLKYGQQIVRQLFAVTQVIRWVEAVFVGMLSLVALIFINNTIRLAIYARRKEIGIMRLVGASNWFIRTPFLLEGVAQALVGAALAIATIIGLQSLALPRLGEALPFMSVAFSASSTTQVAAILVLGGVVIGLAGSGFAMRRYMKV